MPQQRNSLGLSADIDPVSKMRMRQDDNWNKIVQYSHKIHQITMKEQQDKKKETQLQMREALRAQLE